MTRLVLAAIAILAGLLLTAFLIGRLFRDKKTRKLIMFGAIGVYLLAAAAFVGFIAFVMSGDLNR